MDATGEACAQVPPHALARAMHRIVCPEHFLRQLVEEAAGTSRDIGEVLEDTRDLVRPPTRLEPIAVLKG